MVTATFWLYGLRFVSRGVGLIRNVVLARLLTPEDFGLLGIAVITAGVLEVFTRFGLEQSIIQRRDITRREINTLWTFDALRSILLSAVMFFAAPGIGTLLNSPDSVPVIRVMSLLPALWFLRHVDFIVLRRELKFKPIFYVEATAEIASVAIGVWLAIEFHNVWSLVASMLTTRIVIVLGSFVVAKTKLGLVWDLRIVGSHFQFGRQILAADIGQYTFNNIDDWFVGKVLGVSALGLYRWAFTFGNLVTTELSMVLAQVLFPAFSRLQGNTQEMGRGLLRTQKLLIMVTAPLTASFVFFSRPLVDSVLGEVWLPMVPALQILLLWGGVRVFREIYATVFWALGRPGLVAYATYGKLIVLLALLWPARQYGIEGVAAAVLIASMLEFPVLIWMSARQLNLPVIAILSPFIVPTIAAFGIGAAAFWGSPQGAGWIRVVTGVSLTMGGYILIMALLDRLFSMGYSNEFRYVWSIARSRMT